MLGFVEGDVSVSVLKVLAPVIDIFDEEYEANVNDTLLNVSPPPAKVAPFADRIMVDVPAVNVKFVVVDVLHPAPVVVQVTVEPFSCIARTPRPDESNCWHVSEYPLAPVLNVPAVRDKVPLVVRASASVTVPPVAEIVTLLARDIPAVVIVAVALNVIFAE